MITYDYEVYYKTTPENKHRGTIEAESEEEAVQMVRDVYFAAPVEVNLLIGNGDELYGNGDEDSTALVSDNPGPRQGEQSDPDAPPRVHPKLY